MQLSKLKINLPKLPLLLLIIPLLVLAVAFFRQYLSKGDYVYTKVKVSQGLWWASSKAPEHWFIQSLESDKLREKTSSDSDIELLSFTYYPSVGGSVGSETTYSIYMDIKIRVKKSKDGRYIFNRERVAVGSPIELDFPTVLVTGTVINLSDEPIVDKYVTKTVEMTGRNLWPWQYESVKVGDKYFDGKRQVFEVTNKRSRDTLFISQDLYGNVTGRDLEPRKYMTITATIILKETEDQKLFFGEEQEIRVGTPFNLVTKNANYAFFTISDLKE